MDIIPFMPREESHRAELVTDEAGLQAAFEVRKRVFVEEQGVPPDLELDGHDAAADHVVVEVAGKVVATGRLLLEDGEARIGRIAVLPEWRRRGIAGEIITALERQATQRGAIEVMLHAQTHAQGLYDKLGYIVSGNGFVEAGIDHVLMIKRLSQDSKQGRL
ncbi:MAG: GNAT family N-acetyltransferase [Dehalococcoidia bacterium]